MVARLGAELVLERMVQLRLVGVWLELDGAELRAEMGKREEVEVVWESPLFELVPQVSFRSGFGLAAAVFGQLRRVFEGIDKRKSLRALDTRRSRIEP